MSQYTDTELVEIYGFYPLPYWASLNSELNSDGTITTAQGTDPLYGHVPDGYPYFTTGLDLGLLEMPSGQDDQEKLLLVNKQNLRGPVSARIQDYQTKITLNLLFTGVKEIMDAVTPAGTRSTNGAGFGNSAEPNYYILSTITGNLYNENVFSVSIFYKCSVTRKAMQFTPAENFVAQVEFQLYHQLMQNGCYRNNLLDQYFINAAGQLSDQHGKPLDMHSNYKDYPALNMSGMLG